MMDKNNAELIKDVDIIKKLSSKIDYSNKHLVGQLCNEIEAKHVLNSPIGVKYRKKLSDIAAGKDNGTCIICNSKLDSGPIFCKTCLGKINAIKGKELKETPIESNTKPVENNTPSKSISKSFYQKSIVAYIIAIILFVIFFGVKIASFVSDYRQTATIESRDSSVSYSEKSTSSSSAKDSVSSRHSNFFRLSDNTKTFIVLILLIASYLYVLYYKKTYREKTGFEKGGLLNYKFSIAQAIALLLAFLSKPYGSSTVGDYIFFLICVLVVLFGEYMAYQTVLKTTGDKKLAQKAMVAQLSAIFLIAFVVAIIVLVVSLIVNKLQEEKKKMDSGNSEFKKNLMFAITLHSLMTK